MVTEATENNIHAALNNTFHISLPWLDETKKIALIDKTFNKNVHPITGSTSYLCLFDRFHERNVQN